MIKGPPRFFLDALCWAPNGWSLIIVLQSSTWLFRRTLQIPLAGSYTRKQLFKTFLKQLLSLNVFITLSSNQRDLRERPLNSVWTTAIFSQICSWFIEKISILILCWGSREVSYTERAPCSLFHFLFVCLFVLKVVITKQGSPTHGCGLFETGPQEKWTSMWAWSSTHATISANGALHQAPSTHAWSSICASGRKHTHAACTNGAMPLIWPSSPLARAVNLERLGNTVIKDREI